MPWKARGLEVVAEAVLLELPQETGQSVLVWVDVMMILDDELSHLCDAAALHEVLQ